MTPASHKAEAETLLTTIETTPATATTLALTRARVHARLSKAAGTGTHYVTADAQLAVEEAAGTVPSMTMVRVALAHAHLAD